MNMEARIYDFQAKVLVTRDDDQYVAHALEMDLVAYGDTEDAALDEVVNLMQNQISFAFQKDNMRLIDFKAPKEFFNDWEKAQTDYLLGVVSGKGKPAHIKMRAFTVGFQKEEIEAMRKRMTSRKAFDPTPVCA